MAATALSEERNAAFEEFINTFEARYAGGGEQRGHPHAAPPQSTLSITEEGLVQAALVVPRPPCWLRFKKNLAHLPAVKRYRSDLALAFQRKESEYDVLLIPRFKFRYEEGRRRPSRRLFHRNLALAAGVKGKALAEGGKNCIWLDKDQIFEPFTLKSKVPLNAFEPKAKIKADDVALFYRGMVQFWDLNAELSAPITKKFMLSSCQLYLQSPFLINERVLAFAGHSIGHRGRIRAIEELYCSIGIEGSVLREDIDIVNLCRWFQPGDHVKVHWTEWTEWRGAVGLVLKVEGDLVTVYKDGDYSDVSDFFSWNSVVSTSLSRKPFKTGNLCTMKPSSLLALPL